MRSTRLSNYLRTNRKRSGLSQEEIAFLLGSQSGAKACRYERFVREPSLETALAFQAIFHKSVNELFAGLYHKLEKQVVARAKVLSYRISLQKPSKLTAHKLQTLARMADGEPNNREPS